MPLESIQTPRLISHFVTLQTYYNVIIQILINLHTIIHNDKAKKYKYFANDKLQIKNRNTLVT